MNGTMPTTTATQEVTTNTKQIERRFNEFINTSICPQASKLSNKSVELISNFKNLNEELKDIIRLEKDLKIKEMTNNGKKVELLNIERRLKEKNTMYY
jgi:hypothetical protein